MGYERTVKLENLIKAYEYGAVNSFEIAEYLNVTEKHLVSAINYYKNRYGTSTNLGNYIIFFEPYIKIERIESLFDYLITD
jgi:hypothetical protein